jgi:hypothetical protein
MSELMSSERHGASFKDFQMGLRDIETTLSGLRLSAFFHQMITESLNCGFLSQAFSYTALNVSLTFVQLRLALKGKLSNVVDLSTLKLE